MAEQRETDKYVKCSKCKCKHINDDEHIKNDFGYNRLNERYKTCTTCRSKPQQYESEKITCDVCNAMSRCKSQLIMINGRRLRHGAYCVCVALYLPCMVFCGIVLCCVVLQCVVTFGVVWYRVVALQRGPRHCTLRC